MEKRGRKRITKKLSKNVDILYSLTAHENPNFISKLIENINKYNKNYEIYIIINGSDSVRKDNVFSIHKNFIFNHKFKKRRKFHYDILGAHVDNYILAREKGIHFNHMILLASNCLFIKQIDLNILEYIPKESDLGRWVNGHHLMEHCHELVKIFLDLGVPRQGNRQGHNPHKIKSIFSHIHRHHEGTVYNKVEADKIFNFIIEKIHDKIKYSNYVAEEVILPYLEYVFYDKILRPRIIVMDPDKEPSTDSYKDVITCKYETCMRNRFKYGIKGVNRNAEDYMVNML